MSLTIKCILTSIKSLWKEIEDTGWQTASLSGDFKAYSSAYAPEYRKVGKLVEIRGEVSPTKTLDGGSTTSTIFTLPEGYRPAMRKEVVCQGSSLNKWLLTITTDGNVNFSRYGTSEATDVTTSTWLPFSTMFYID